MAERPNFLFVFDDQHRYDYLDAASRMTLATGLSPIRAGVLMNGFGKAAHDTSTFYQRLRDHGYWVASTGKLHLGPLGAAGPHGQPPGAYRLGFTHPHDCEGKMAAGYQRKANGPYSHYLQELGLGLADRGFRGRLYRALCHRVDRRRTRRESVVYGRQFRRAAQPLRSAKRIRRQIPRPGNAEGDSQDRKRQAAADIRPRPGFVAPGCHRGAAPVLRGDRSHRRPGRHHARRPGASGHARQHLYRFF